MYRIKEFSKLAKITVKTLRYYEKEGLLKPAFVNNNSYRYYDASQLVILSKIISLRQIGFSIKQIKEIFAKDMLREKLTERKNCVLKEISEYRFIISKIDYLLEKNEMKYQITIKDVPEYIIYYKEGVIQTIDDIGNFYRKKRSRMSGIKPKSKMYWTWLLLFRILRQRIYKRKS